MDQLPVRRTHVILSGLRHALPECSWQSPDRAVFRTGAYVTRATSSYGLGPCAADLGSLAMGRRNGHQAEPVHHVVMRRAGMGGTHGTWCRNDELYGVSCM
jgi:hypothetical protein